jgi:RNA recognition motif-containing protein
MYDEFQQMLMQQMGTQRDECTTVILRNLPCAFLREDLIKKMDAKGFAGLYNFVYLPVDFETEMGMGYAFVNMITTEEVKRFMIAFNGFRDWPCWSSKICVVDLSRTQGLDANIGRYRDSPVMGDEVPERFRPVLFDGSKRVPFPEPTKELSKVLPKSIGW